MVAIQCDAQRAQNEPKRRGLKRNNNSLHPTSSLLTQIPYKKKLKQKRLYIYINIEMRSLSLFLSNFAGQATEDKEKRLYYSFEFNCIYIYDIYLYFMYFCAILLVFFRQVINIIHTNIYFQVLPARFDRDSNEIHSK